jgi:anti-sigma factor RsiW
MVVKEKPQMKCPNREQIRRLWENELSHYQAKKVDEHLMNCPKCRALYAEVEAEEEAAKYRRVAPLLGLGPETATKEDVYRAMRRRDAEGIMELAPDEDPSLEEIEEAARALLAAMKLRPEASLSEEDKKRIQKARGFLRVAEALDSGREPTPEDN